MTLPSTEAPGSLAGERFQWFHWIFTALISLAFAANGVAFGAVSFALPGVRREWGLSPPELGVVSAALSAGQVIGSLLIGWLADRLGRRQVFAATIALGALGTGLAALAPSPRSFTLLLLCAGLGIGGVAPVAVSLLGEFAPPRVRGQLMAWTQVCWAAGWCLTAAGGVYVSTSLGWRWTLALGALPIVLAVLSWRFTPESPRFLLAHGRRAEAEALARSLMARYGVHVPLPEQQRADRRLSPWRNLHELWGQHFRRRTFTLWLTWFLMVASFNGPIVWMPTILSSAGSGEAEAARLSLIIGTFMLPASLLSVLLIDRLGRRPLLLASLGLAALGAFGLGLAGSEWAIVLAGGGLAGGVLAAWPIVLGYTAELYPTRMRASAAGWAGAVSRSGGIVSPIMLGLLLSSWGASLTVALGVFGLMLLVAVVLVAVQGEETSGRTLEELSG